MSTVPPTPPQLPPLTSGPAPAGNMSALADELRDRGKATLVLVGEICATAVLGYDVLTNFSPPALAGLAAVIAGIAARTSAITGGRPQLRRLCWTLCGLATVFAAVVGLVRHLSRPKTVRVVPAIVKTIADLPEIPLMAPWQTQPAPITATHLVAVGRIAFAWGGRRLDPIDGGPPIVVPYGIAAVTECLGNLVVVDKRGYARLIDIDDGHQIGRALHVGPRADHPSCGSGSVFFTMQAHDKQRAYVLRARATDLAVTAKIQVGPPPGSTTAPQQLGATKAIAGSVLVAVGGISGVVRLDLRGNQMGRSFPQIPHPTAIGGYAAGALVVEGDKGCLRRISGPTGLPDDGGIAAPRPVLAVSHQNGEILVAAKGGAILRRLDSLTLRSLAPSVTLPAGIRVTDIVAVGHGWIGLDPRHHLVLPLTRAGLMLHEAVRRQAGARTPHRKPCW